MISFLKNFIHSFTEIMPNWLVGLSTNVWIMSNNWREKVRILHAKYTNK